MDALDDLVARQAGVVSRGQLLAHGLAATDVRRRLRRRELVTVVPGVYVDHTGALTWRQRAWAAVLALEPAALCHRSAIRALDGPGRVEADAVLHVAVDRARSPSAPPGVRLHHLVGLQERTLWSASPPRLRVEHAVLDVAADARDDLTAIAVLADAVQARLTTASRLRATLDERRRVHRRAFLAAVLDDVAAGTCSVLEHGYLDRVERPHGLPASTRQVADSRRGPLYRDVEYREQRLYVELDGRLFHDGVRARDRDLERDLDAAVTGRATVRLGWGQVFGRSCDTALRVGAVLRRRGWTGAPTPCPDCVTAAAPYAGVTG